MTRQVNRTMERPILNVSAFTVRSDWPFSFIRKKSAENKLPMIMSSVKTVAILIHIMVSYMSFNRLCDWSDENAIQV